MSDDKATRLAAIRAANAARNGSQSGILSTTPMQIAANDNEINEDLATSFAAFIFMLMGAIIGVVLAVFIVPLWLPNLSNSILSTQPKVYWYLSRSSAIVAYALLWLAMLFGLLITGKLSRLWPGGPTAFELHQHTSLLGLTFALFHALILMGDSYIKASLQQILIPFNYTGYETVWVGLGQLALYGLALVGLSFYVKKYIGRSLWRLIHFLSFIIFVLALAHGIWSGTDSSSELMRVIYWASGSSVLFLTIYRVLAAIKGQRKTPGLATP